MKVLAERSDKIFIWGPIVMLLCILVFSNRSVFMGSLKGRYIVYFCVTVFGLVCFDLCHRITVPKIIIEYDDYGIYVYKHKKQQPITLRYSDLKGVLIMEGVNDSYELNEGVSVDSPSTGMLRIQSTQGLTTLYGIKNVRQVGDQLKQMVDDYNRKAMEHYEARIEQMKRQRELEELQKHDPNT